MSSVLADASSFWHRHAPSVGHRTADELRDGPSPRPPLAERERILRRFRQDAEQLLATDRALYRARAGEDWLRIAWTDIAIVGWSRADHVLSLRLFPSAGGEREMRMPGDAVIAAFADERVAATRLLLTHAEIRPGMIATVTAVRADDATVCWRVVFDDDEAATDPALGDACERLIAELRGLAGC